MNSTPTTTPPKPSNHTPSRHLRTTNDLLKAIPPKWRGAEIFIGGGIGQLKKIHRVSLEKNDSGRTVILIHEEDFS